MNTRKSPSLIRFVPLALVLYMSSSAFAQFGASLSGTIQDPSGAAIPGATIVLVNTDTQQTRTGASSASGTYRFGELPPGTYNLTATAATFKKTSLTNLVVAAETPRNVDITLSSGGNTEIVNVNADVLPVLQTSDASIGITINSETIQRLPTIGSNPYEILRTSPG